MSFCNHKPSEFFFVLKTPDPASSKVEFTRMGMNGNQILVLSADVSAELLNVAEKDVQVPIVTM